jgi:cytochrome P450
MLAIDKDAQQKVIEEVDAVIGSTDEIDSDAINKFTYVEMVIKESLRLLGPGGTLGRETNKEMELGGYTIPKGSCFVLSMYGMRNTGATTLISSDQSALSRKTSRTSILMLSLHFLVRF